MIIDITSLHASRCRPLPHPPSVLSLASVPTQFIGSTESHRLLQLGYLDLLHADTDIVTSGQFCLQGLHWGVRVLFASAQNCPDLLLPPPFTLFLILSLQKDPMSIKAIFNHVVPILLQALVDYYLEYLTFFSNPWLCIPLYNISELQGRCFYFLHSLVFQFEKRMRDFSREEVSRNKRGQCVPASLCWCIVRGCFPS